MSTHAKVLENILVWSAHRTKTLGMCARKYYFNYVGSWQGWDTASPPEVQAAYRVKHLTTPELEIGNILHQQIRLIFLKADCGQVIDPATEIKIAQEKFETFVQSSASRRLEELSAKHHKLMLHEMGMTLTPTEVGDHVDEIDRLLSRFLEFDDVKALLADPSVLLHELLDSPGFEIGNDLGVPARPKTDAVFVTLDKIVVCDWKTGAPSDDHRDGQGLVYDLFVRSQLALPPTQVVEVRFYYLQTGQVVHHVFTEEERGEKLWAIGEQFEELKSYSDDPRVNVGSESRFPARVSRACFYCNHRLMCEDFLRSKFANSTQAVP
jgi:hypothetical protein